jgi:hypothetical protein
MSDHPAFVRCRDTLVAYFDIIAYSQYLQLNGSEQVIKPMEEFHQQISTRLTAHLGNLIMDPLILSDSIIVALDTSNHPVDAETLKWFLEMCSAAMGFSMRKRFPLRGAIGGGDFYKKGETLVSSALVDAVQYEKQQEWLGAVVTPKAIEVINKARVDLSSDGFKNSVGFGDIPWKSGEKTEWYYLKPPSHIANPDWVRKYLPSHFDIVKGARKILNSHCLYRKGDDPNDSEKDINNSSL